MCPLRASALTLLPLDSHLAQQMWPPPATLNSSTLLPLPLTQRLQQQLQQQLLPSRQPCPPPLPRQAILLLLTPGLLIQVTLLCQIKHMLTLAPHLLHTSKTLGPLAQHTLCQTPGIPWQLLPIPGMQAGDRRAQQQSWAGTTGGWIPATGHVMVGLLCHCLSSVLPGRCTAGALLHPQV